MPTLAQIGRGAVLLISMALVACYIDVYTTGKFPWQHAAAKIPATIPSPEFFNETIAQPKSYAELPENDLKKSIYLSGTKTFTGQTTVLPGKLNTATQAAPQADQKATSFMGGSKTIMLPTRLPETATTNPPPAAAPDKMQFMSGFKSPGPSVMQGTSLPVLPQTAPPGNPPATYPPAMYPQSPALNNPLFRPNISPPSEKPAANGTSTNSVNQPLFMSGSKSMGPATLPLTLPSAGPRVKTPTQIPGQLLNPISNQSQQTAPAQQQTTPLKIAPLSPAGSY